jgi:cell division protein YceG involved in septum cleavage
VEGQQAIQIVLLASAGTIFSM